MLVTTWILFALWKETFGGYEFRIHRDNKVWEDLELDPPFTKNMSHERWSKEDETLLRLLQDRRRRARESQRQGRAEEVERRRDTRETDEMQSELERAVQSIQDVDGMFDSNLA